MKIDFDFLQKYIEEHSNFSDSLTILRDIINSTTMVETIKWNMPVFKKSKTFTYFCFFKNHINMGFYNFERIDDPNNLLQGEGNTMRHIKIKSMSDIDTKLFKQWLKATAE